jgi:2-oxoglutarate dehydrogenase E2 component (dihydrolipoamide succinyltransferase)
MAIELKIPSVGESVTEVEIGQWLKSEGDTVARDENVVMIESEKATVELPAPSDGTLTKIVKRTGEKAAVGDVIAYLEPGKKSSAAARPPAKTEEPAPKPAPSAPAPNPTPAPVAAPAPTPAAKAVPPPQAAPVPQEVPTSPAP